MIDDSPWEKIEFTIVLPPRGQARTHQHVLTKKDGSLVRGKSGRAAIVNYKPAKQARDEESLMALAYRYRPAHPLKGPILLGIRAFLPIPKGIPDHFRYLAPERKKDAWFRLAALSGEVRPESKPDWDNLQKNLKDILKGVFFVDDAQVIGNLPDSGKYYGDPARWEVVVMYRRDRQDFEVRGSIQPASFIGKAAL